MLSRSIRTLAALALLIPHLALAQALTEAAPSADSVAQGSPQVVELTFSEDVKFKSSKIVVKGAKGDRVDRNDIHAVQDSRHLAVGLKELLPGHYQVNWTVTSARAHQATGSFGFTVGE